MTVTCPSRIVAVTVHARGAVVTRAVELPKELPTAACELTISALPALAPAGSLRAEVEGDREVVGLRSRLVLPERPLEPARREARLRELELRAHRLRLEQEHLSERRGVLHALEPSLRGLRRAGADPAGRARDALAANALVTDLLSGLDARLRELADGLRALEREREALELERAQDARPPAVTREVSVRLGPGGDAPLGGLQVQYVVPTARWWPAYAARLSAGGTRAEWSMEAFVAQTSGEDWAGVALSLSTADLVQDARLPELPSLRLGRSQPPRPTGFRAPPEGLEALFQGYDRDRRRLGGPPAPPPSPKRPAEPKPQARPSPAPEPEPVGELPEELELEAFDRTATRAGGPPADAPSRSVKAKKRSISFGAAPSGGFAPVGGGGGAVEYRRREVAPAEAPADPPAELEPADAWLDFDALVLGPGEDRARRGRLNRVSEDAVARPLAEAEAALAAIGTPAGAVDPVAGRGRFDHQYSAEGRVDVRSRREAQRVALSASLAECRPQLRLAPAVEQVAYREVELINPFAGPLLAGPVDVFLDGSLLTTSEIPKVGRGGPLQLGLGAEDRIKVARNARTAESTAGLIGKTTAVEHTVTIELVSSLERAVPVDVIDRVPVSDDDDVTVELVRDEPEGEPYDQRDRDAPIRGGRRWRVSLPGRGEARIEFVYRVSFPSRRELVGGNRRD